MPGTGRYRRVMATSPTVARQAVEVTRSTAAKSPPTSHAWTPWEVINTDASTRFKTEIAAALSKLQAAQLGAGQLLDAAYAQAAGAANPLREAAWTAWNTYMAAATSAEDAIVGPAVTAYDKAITDATTAYNAAMADAQNTYKAMLSSAQAAKAAAGTIVATV